MKITKRTVDALAVEGGDAVFWDQDLAGYGVRIYAAGRKVYVVQSRVPNGPKRVTIGRDGDIAVERVHASIGYLADFKHRGLNAPIQTHSLNAFCLHRVNPDKGSTWIGFLPPRPRNTAVLGIYRATVITRLKRTD